MKGKTWNVYRVSDLNNFDYNKPNTFPRYGRILSRYLVDSFTEAVTLKATFLLKPDIQGFEGEDPPVYIKIEDVQFDKPRIAYEGKIHPSYCFSFQMFVFKLIPFLDFLGLLLSAYESGNAKLEGAVHLPVLLARGSRIVRTKVHECLAMLFSSAVHEITFPGEDMLWMIASWIGYINETKTSKEVDFLYAIPSRTDTIKCQYPVHFIKNLWNWYVPYNYCRKGSASMFYFSPQHSWCEQSSGWAERS